MASLKHTSDIYNRVELKHIPSWLQDEKVAPPDKSFLSDKILSVFGLF